ncbi:g2729 [Coccomyxa viridis]|uniref:G2729 protein n=1 Tax=Coccomyxa viridis TaxID=1274662 RepID=A0ABP1FQ38_9CHLO
MDLLSSQSGLILRQQEGKWIRLTLLESSGMASPEQPWTPGGSGDPPSGKGNGEGSSSGQGSARRPVIDLFGTDIAPAAIVLVLVLLGLMKAAMEPRCIC